MKKIAIVLHESPFNSALSREAQDMIMALAAVEHQVTVIYQGDAVLHLVAPKMDAALGCKNFIPTQKLFALYDIAAVVASTAALAKFQITREQTIIPVTELSEMEIADLLAQQQHVLRF
jgi:tRNA 2-thiouridine synthesizing protein C